MNQKNLYIAIALVVVLLVGGGLYWYFTANGNNGGANNSQTTENNNSSVVEGSQDTSGDTMPVAVLSYAQALSIYKDRRIQLSTTNDGYCSVVPSNAVYKKGTAIMFDNRIGKTVSFSLDGHVYSIKAYGFRIITLSTASALPHAMSLDCQNGQNNATITLE